MLAVFFCGLAANAKPGKDGHKDKDPFELVGKGACRAPTASKIYGDYTCFPSYLGCNTGELVDGTPPTCPDGYLMCEEAAVSLEECEEKCLEDPACVGIEVSENSLTGNGKCELHYVDLEYASEQVCYTNDEGTFQLLGEGACRTLVPNDSGSYAGTFTVVSGGTTSLEGCQNACVDWNGNELYGQMFGIDVYKEQVEKADEVYQRFVEEAKSLDVIEWADFYPEDDVNDGLFSVLLQLVYALDASSGDVENALEYVGIEAPTHCFAVEYTLPLADEATKCELHHAELSHTDPTDCYRKVAEVCAAEGEECGGKKTKGKGSSSSDCCEEGLTCFEKSRGKSECQLECPAGWDCEKSDDKKGGKDSSSDSSSSSSEDELEAPSSE